jgi:hypothetical protein
MQNYLWPKAFKELGTGRTAGQAKVGFDFKIPLVCYNGTFHVLMTKTIANIFKIYIIYIDYFENQLQLPRALFSI